MKRFEDLKIKFNLSIGYVNACQEDSEPLSDYFKEEEWNEMTDLQKETAVSDIASSWSENYIELSGWVE